MNSGWSSQCTKTRNSITDDLLRSLAALEDNFQKASIPEQDLAFASEDAIVRAIDQLDRVREGLVVLVDDDLFTVDNVGERRFNHARDLLDLSVREASVYEELRSMYGTSGSFRTAS